jgi:DNA invertase Pin-like site-specific DNA recombinase
LGRLLLNLLASLAEFELELIRERVKAGMERARRQGRRIGRPRVIDRRGFSQRFGVILERLIQGDISRRQAAKELKIGYATLKRLLDAHAKELQDPNS